MKPFVSVITCSYNPRPHYIEWVLAALHTQTLAFEHWEFLLIDNASDRPLAEEIDISWHPNARHIHESRLGLTFARLRGIEEAIGDILVFVDDDNVLDADYLEVVLRISKDFPFLGAWGGQIIGNYEVPPPDWAKPYLAFLAIREFSQDKWSNLLHQHETTPCGAGLCVRRSVGQHYVAQLVNNPERQNLDRKGKLLTSCGDSDLAFTACDVGLGTGQFVSLKLSHLIPAERLQERYLLKLIEGLSYSGTLLNYFRGIKPTTPTPTSLFQTIREICRVLCMESRERRFYFAKQRGEHQAAQEIFSSLTNSLNSLDNSN